MVPYKEVPEPRDFAQELLGEYENQGARDVNTGTFTDRRPVPRAR